MPKNERGRMANDFAPTPTKKVTPHGAQILRDAWGVLLRLIIADVVRNIIKTCRVAT